MKESIIWNVDKQAASCGATNRTNRYQHNFEHQTSYEKSKVILRPKDSVPQISPSDQMHLEIGRKERIFKGEDGAVTLRVVAGRKLNRPIKLLPPCQKTRQPKPDVKVQG